MRWGGSWTSEAMGAEAEEAWEAKVALQVAGRAAAATW